MQTITPAEFQQFKTLLISTFKAFIEFCDLHGLRYYAVCGTALGAVRHQGMIPWDDDIDVGMPRPDYERFIRLMKEKPMEGYRLCVPEPDSDYYLTFAKFTRKGTTILEEYYTHYNLGVFVDVFPFDGAGTPVEKMSATTYNKSVALSNLYASASGIFHSSDFLKMILRGELRKALSLGRYQFNRLKKREKIFAELKTIYQKYGYEESTYIANFQSGVSAEKEIFPKEWLGEGKMLPFEGFEVRVPNEVEKYLTVQFGDFMQLPPVEERVSCHTKYYFNLEKELSPEEITAIQAKNR